ncbi:sensitivity to high expression protein she9 [Podila humilis]|nr:sensitivity to high expression protein she9 [Podila humilis]
MASNFRILPSGLARAMTASAGQMHSSCSSSSSLLQLAHVARLTTTRPFTVSTVLKTSNNGSNNNNNSSSSNSSLGLRGDKVDEKLAAEAAERKRVEAQDAALKEILDSAAAEKKKLEEEMVRAAEAKAREIAAAKEAAERAAKAVEEAQRKAKMEAERLAQEKVRQEKSRVSVSQSSSSSSTPSPSSFPSSTQNRMSNDGIGTNDDVAKAGSTSASLSSEAQLEKKAKDTAATAAAATAAAAGPTAATNTNSRSSVNSQNQAGSTAALQSEGAYDETLEPFKARLLPYKRSLESSTEYLRSVLPDNLRQLSESVKRKDYKDTIAQLSEHLNNFTGYNSINDLKHKVITHGDSLDEARIKLVQAKQAYEDAIGNRSDTQKAINDLLQRKHLWSPNDVIRFTDLYRSEHANEQAELKTKSQYKEAEADVEEKSRRLTRVIMERYHEEQVWSDKIRAASTYGTWGLVGVNVMAFLIVQAFVEPRRRRKQIERYEGLVQDLTERGVLPNKTDVPVGGGHGTASPAIGGTTAVVASMAVPMTDSGVVDGETSTTAAMEVGGALMGGEDVLLKVMQSMERAEERLERMESLLVKNVPPTTTTTTEPEADKTAVKSVEDEEDAGDYVVTEDGSVVFVPNAESVEIGDDIWREEILMSRRRGKNTSDDDLKQQTSGHRMARILRDGDEEVPMKRRDLLLTGLGGAILGGLVTVAIMLKQ